MRSEITLLHHLDPYHFVLGWIFNKTEGLLWICSRMVLMFPHRYSVALKSAYSLSLPIICFSLLLLLTLELGLLQTVAGFKTLAQGSNWDLVSGAQELLDHKNRILLFHSHYQMQLQPGLLCHKSHPGSQIPFN